MPAVNKNFEDIITFTRGSGGGIFNAQDKYEWLGNDVPRFDYDPVTKAVKGLLIEEQRANLLRYSSDFANAAWAKAGATITTGALTALDAKAANKLVESSENSNHALFSSAAVTNGVSHTVSFVVKAEGRSNVRIRLAATSHGITGTFLADANFDLSNGTYLSGTNTDRSIKHLGSGWYRVSVTATSTSTTIGAALMLCTTALAVAYQGDGTSGIYIWGAQLEAGSSPSSYIPTTDAQVTRAADIASVNELSPWYNPEQGTLFVEYLAPARTPTAQYPGVIGLSATATTSQIGIYNRTDNGVYAMLVRDGGVVHADVSIPGTAFTSGAVVKVALGYASDGVSGCVNGGTIASDTSVVIPAVDHLRIGQMTDVRIGSHIKSIRYFPRRLSDAELQALTA